MFPQQNAFGGPLPALQVPPQGVPADETALQAELSSIKAGLLLLGDTLHAISRRAVPPRGEDGSKGPVSVSFTYLQRTQEISILVTQLNHMAAEIAQHV